MNHDTIISIKIDLLLLNVSAKLYQIIKFKRKINLLLIGVNVNMKIATYILAFKYKCFRERLSSSARNLVVEQTIAISNHLQFQRE